MREIVARVSRTYLETSIFLLLSLPPPTIPLPPPPDVFVTGKGYSRRGLRPAANVWKLATASPISADRQGGAEARKRGRGGEEGASGSRELGEKNKAGPRRRETAAETWRASSSGCPPPVSPLPPPPPSSSSRCGGKSSPACCASKTLDLSGETRFSSGALFLSDFYSSLVPRRTLSPIPVTVLPGSFAN